MQGFAWIKLGEGPEREDAAVGAYKLVRDNASEEIDGSIFWLGDLPDYFL